MVWSRGVNRVTGSNGVFAVVEHDVGLVWPNRVTWCPPPALRHETKGSWLRLAVSLAQPSQSLLLGVIEQQHSSSQSSDDWYVRPKSFAR